MSSSASRRVRSDAARNRALVLAAADQVFSAHGLTASLEMIATHAGLGVGTVHRAFGSKNALIEALYADTIDRAVEVITQCGKAPSGWEALRRTMWRLTLFQLHDRGLQQLLFSAADPEGASLHARIKPLLSAIVARAKSEHQLRADFAATDIPVLTHAIAATAAGMPELAEQLAQRHLAFILKGIAPIPDDAPVAAPLSDDAFASWLRNVE